MFAVRRSAAVLAFTLLGLILSRPAAAAAPAYELTDLGEVFGDVVAADSQLRVVDINNRGELLLNVWNPVFSWWRPHHSYVYSPGMLREIRSDQLDRGTEVQGAILNDQGKVAGTTKRDAAKRLFRYAAGNVELLAATGNGNSEFKVQAIDGNGDVHAFYINRDGGSPVVYRVLNSQKLNQVDASVLSSILTRTNIAGYSVDGLTPILARGGSQLDLNTAVPQGSPWLLQQAVDMNDAGYIVGVGTRDGAVSSFLLTPAGAPQFLDLNIRQWRRPSGGNTEPSTRICPDGAGHFTFARGNFDSLNLTKAWLPYADLYYSSLKSTVLRRADLSGADLRLADARRANLTKADLTGARIDGTDFRGSQIFTRQIEEAATSQNVIRRRGWIRGLRLEATDESPEQLRTLYLRYDPQIPLRIRNEMVLNSWASLLLEIPEAGWQGPLVRFAKQTQLSGRGALQLLLPTDDFAAWVDRDLTVFDWSGTQGSINLDLARPSDPAFEWDASRLQSDGIVTLRPVDGIGLAPAAVPEPAIAAGLIIPALLLLRRNAGSKR